MRNFDKEKNIFLQLERNLSLIPSAFYWKDRSHRFLGANAVALQYVGLNSIAEVVGKTDYDLWPADDAKRYVEDDKYILETGKAICKEDSYFDINGKLKFCQVIKAPLFDDEDNIIGIIGNSVDVTSEKEAEKFRHEYETQRVLGVELEKFRRSINKLAHDIRSPLASLMMVVKVCQNIPEKERVALREAANTISNITNNLITHYREAEAEFTDTVEERESILISPVILQILTEKTYQFSDSRVKFDHQFSESGHFAWIKIQPTAFKRMLSNLINNAVDSYDSRGGVVTLYLDVIDDQVNVTIEDKGKGMSTELVEKILAEVAVSEGKEDGHGIGLTQVRETLQNNEGRWVIESTVGRGTKFKLTFPRSKSLGWLADLIELNEDDTVIILDDDSSIHMAWDFRFEKILTDYPAMKTRHFELGQQTINFINDLSPENRKKIVLLADYELLKQDLTGLDVISQTNISRSILVTSHYADKDVRKSASLTQTKILPKQLASEVPIEVCRAGDFITESELKIVDIIFVDDEQYLLDGYKMFAFGKKVDTFSVPEEFLEKARQYHRNTKIMLDQNFANSDFKGTQIAEQLYSMGFDRLYLLSGGSSAEIKIPNYVKFVRKTDLDSLTDALNDMS